MITKITVNDFQSIEQAELDFGGQGSITTIVGPSSTGKSALLRAMNLLMRNSSSVPVRAQSKKAQTKISASVDDKAIAVLRGKSLSTYKIDSIEYSKSGVTVPEKVQEVLNLYSASPDVHFSFQFDKPYLLDESGSTISTVLGSLTQAHVLRNAAKEGNRRALETKRLITTRQDDIENISNQIETEFSTLDDDERTYQDAHTAYLIALNASETVSEVFGALADVRAAESAAQALVDVPVRDATQEIQIVETSLYTLDSILTCLTDIEEAKNVLTSLPESKNAAVEIEQTQENLNLLCSTEGSLNELKSYVDSFNIAKINHAQALEAFEVASEQVRVLESQLPRCETCGQVLHNE